MGNRKTTVLTMLVIVLVALLSGSLIVSVKLYLDTKAAVTTLQTKTATTGTDEAKILIDRVSQHMVLPKEEPKIITVSNVDILKKEQPFFAVASNGDKLLVYSQKLILFNPTLDRIIDVAQIRPTGGATPAPTAPVQPEVPAETATPTATPEIPQIQP